MIPSRNAPPATPRQKTQGSMECDPRRCFGLFDNGSARIRTWEGVRQRVYSPSPLANSGTLPIGALETTRRTSRPACSSGCRISVVRCGWYHRRAWMGIAPCSFEAALVRSLLRGALPVRPTPKEKRRGLRPRRLESYTFRFRYADGAPAVGTVSRGVGSALTSIGVGCVARARTAGATAGGCSTGAAW